MGSTKKSSGTSLNIIVSRAWLAIPALRCEALLVSRLIFLYVYCFCFVQAVSYVPVHVVYPYIFNSHSVQYDTACFCKCLIFPDFWFLLSGWSSPMATFHFITPILIFSMGPFHHATTGHSFKFEDTIILEREWNKFKHMILEGMHIYSNKDSVVKSGLTIDNCWAPFVKELGFPGKGQWILFMT